MDNLPIGMSIWRDSDGNTYSVEPYNNEKKESKIVKRMPDGKMSVFAGGKYGYLDGQKDKAQFEEITDIAFGRDGAIYLTGGNKIRKIDKLGKVATIYLGEARKQDGQKLEDSSQFFGLDVDGQNNVFAADFGKNRLMKITPDNKISTVFTSEKEWTPLGVATTGDEIYLLEGRAHSAQRRTGNRVLKISADGKSTIVAVLKDANITAQSSNTSDNFLPRATNFVAAETPATVKSLLILASLIGFASIAIAAFIIIALKK